MPFHWLRPPHRNFHNTCIIYFLATKPQGLQREWELAWKKFSGSWKKKSEMHPLILSPHLVAGRLSPVSISSMKLARYFGAPSHNKNCEICKHGQNPSECYNIVFRFSKQKSVALCEKERVENDAFRFHAVQMLFILNCSGNSEWGRSKGEKTCLHFININPYSLFCSR